MRCDEEEPGSPAQWLVFARSDLVLAERGAVPGVLLLTLCFHAQQAAEKSLKAVLVHRGVSSPRTHNLTTLMERLPEGCAPPPEAEEVAALSVYAVAARYPEGRGEIGEEDHRRAIALAKAVVAWAEGAIESVGG